MVLALLLVGAACTDGDTGGAALPQAPEPDPVPATARGSRVGVVLPPTSELDAGVLSALEEQVARLEDAVDGGVRMSRGYPAADPRFVEDVAVWLAEQDTDLVCVMGNRAEEVAATLVSLYRGVGFCALSASSPSSDPEAVEADDGVARVEVRMEELGYLVGVAARIQAHEATVGLVLGGDGLHGARFRLGLLAGLAGVQVIEADIPGGQEASLTDRAEAVLAADADVVVVDGGLGAADAVAAIGDRAVVMAPDAVADDAETPSIALRWRVRWDLVLEDPVRWLAGDRDGSSHTTVGVTDAVFEFALDEGAEPAVGTDLAVSIEGVADGSLDPRVPATAQPGPDGPAPEGSPPPPSPSD